jgi:hypothetical protein
MEYVLASWSFGSGARTATARQISNASDASGVNFMIKLKYMSTFVYWTLYLLLEGPPSNSYMLNLPTSYYPLSCSSLAFHMFASAFEPTGIPMQYISIYKIICFCWGVSPGFNIVGKSWDNRCVVIILTTSTPGSLPIFLTSSLHCHTSCRPYWPSWGTWVPTHLATFDANWLIQQFLLHPSASCLTAWIWCRLDS